MKTRFFKIGILILLAASVSCQKDKNTINEQVIGSWRWVSTLYPYAAHLITPETEGFNRTIVFHDNGKIQEFVDGVLSSSYDYTIGTSPLNPNEYLLKYSETSSSSFSLKNDTLVFNDAYVDGPVTTYVRIK
jgi:hypothetical protein